MHLYKNKPWLIPTLLTIVLVAVGGLYIAKLINQKEPIAADVIRTQLEEMYGGTIDQIFKEGNTYKVEMQRNGASYSAEIDAVTGNVLALSQTSEMKNETPQPRVFTEAEVKEILSKNYSGIVERIILDTNKETPVYEVTLSKDPNFTRVTVDALTGTILSEVVKERPGKNTLITQGQAVDIALGQIKNELVDEVDDVSYEKTEDGGYYLVEIDTKDDREATFQIHAISGKILSVTWEED